MPSFDPFEKRMRARGIREAAIRAFERSYGQLVGESSGLIGEEEIGPVEGLPILGHEGGDDFDAGLLAQTVVIKLNGGLGTSMGLRKAKSLLEVRDGMTFLDLIARQVQGLRQRAGAEVRFLLMNSFSTSADTLGHLEGLEGRGWKAEEVELLQNQVPKVDAASLRPAEWPAQPELEWCPPGHGDLYPALLGSGWLERLLREGVKYAFVSNSDNLGAALDPGILEWFAGSGAPFLMEVTRRTAADRKGGHLARRKRDGRLILREVAQCPGEDLECFQDLERHSFFNTNNLWIQLEALREVLDAEGGVLPLPTICNRKAIDPRDRSSTEVFQLETAMGAAIECFDGAAAAEVPRTRFAPVKSTADLLALRSDCYELRDDGRVALVAERHGVPPAITLGDDYKLVDRLGDLGVPSLKEAVSLRVDGAVRFEPGAGIVGEVTIRGGGGDALHIDRILCDEVVAAAD